MARFLLSRRTLLTGAALGATAPLSGCFDFLADRDDPVRNVMETANSLTYRVQRMLLGSDDLAREYPASEIRQGQRPNGSTDPQDEDYRALLDQDFAPYRLTVDGLVDRPLRVSLDEIRAMPARTQITRHDCVEGWSCIAQWTGTPLGYVLDQAMTRPAARFVVFDCFDSYGSGLVAPVRYYESIDIRDARHAQTILAYGLNGQTLPVENGAPLRVRVERQLGYKMAKYIRAIHVTDTLAGFGGGNGGYWEDNGYEWFAGI
ncbi:molybdopterin-dependent oxidoreductase [Aurantimonas sp. Leaf443]|uniref:molybdopterin-dependent oxidoreductase n=1 Tax=Aurantimonas sp. Leaf443 TaxID=1736378 RepID=UPI0006FD88A6|nr:molybdopterin-dependent oxidoreductase [Aurantimonas sp. Leaf443]KQT83541.1 molybdopterin oxidoreductase [Aurantimonas sp. Leaf443]